MSHKVLSGIGEKALVRQGRKEIFLPNFTITLLRTPHLPPTWASFLVPLNFNKLDIKDYLRNAYGVNVFAVRSYIEQQPVRQDKPDARIPVARKWFRPKAIKKMTVEMDKPFVWPEEPADFSPWDKERMEAAQKSQKEYRESFLPDANQKPAKGKKSLAEQAKALLEGKERWKPQPEEEDEATIPARFPAPR
ncbi:MAG: hypothetical protein M1819_005957 [Sarea resinae]|nr:MAG: hypothetical protein M1819_005957 [Sarea resinae]